MNAFKASPRSYRTASSLLFGLVAITLLLVACQPAPGSPVIPSPQATEASPALPSPQPTEAAPTSEPVASGPRLRITNSGSVPIENLVVLFPQDQVEFGDIQPGETTEYRPVPNGVYRYAAYRLDFEGETLEFPVIDWVGEEPVAGEAFTYVLSLDPALGRWEMLQFVEMKIDP